MKSARFALQPSPRSLARLARHYTQAQDRDDQLIEERLINEISSAVRRAGFYTREQFLEVCEWKSRRPRKRYSAIPEELVIETTRIALSAKHEEVRIGALLLLDGVSWPTASVLLHFGHRDPYPILDFRALEALGISQVPTYTFSFWWSYVTECRRLKEMHQLPDMRTLDRALWLWSAKPEQRS